MSDLPVRDVLILQKWLRMAMRGLSDESAASVREEIREHFVSTREEVLAAGTHPEAASRVALAALGDADEANRAYLDVHLSAREARMLAAMEKKQGRPSKKFIVGSLCVSAFAFLYGIDQGDMFSILVGLLWICSLAAYWMLPRRSRIGGRVARYSMYPMMGLMSYFFDSDWRLNLWFAVVVIVPCVVMERSRMRLRRKLPIEKWPDGLFM